MKNLRIWIFAIILGLFFIGDLFFPIKVFSESENRYLAQKPELNVANLISGEFSQEYEEYIGDQFIFRDKWMNVKTRAESALLKKENNNIIFGQEGFLFNKYIKLPDKFHGNVEILKNFVKENNEKNIYIAIAPNSYQILKEYLPAGLYNIDQLKYLEWMKKELNLKEGKFIDLHQALKEHKDEYIYYKTDHHWTTLGAGYAYQAYAKAAGFQPVAEKQLGEKIEKEFYGTFYSSSPKKEESQDVIWYYPALDGEAYIDGEKKDSIYDLKYLETRDKYGLFLHNNPGKVIIKSELEQEEKAKRILIFKDSYANSMIPFLTKHYEEIQVIDLRYFNGSVKELMEEDWEEILFIFNFTFFSEDPYLIKLKY